MRLNVNQQNALKQVFGNLPGEVFLFGSRVDMNRKGGDIDILWITDNKEFRTLKKEMELTIQFQKILDEKLDLLILPPVDQMANSERAFYSSLKIQRLFE
jgi:predicted nucleotidyltransferase